MAVYLESILAEQFFSFEQFFSLYLHSILYRNSESSQKHKIVYLKALLEVIWFKSIV